MMQSHIQKVCYALITFIFSVPLLYAQQKQPVIQNVIRNVNLDSLKVTLDEITGMKDILLAGKSTRIVSRSPWATGHADAITYLKQRFLSYGLKPVEQPFKTRFTIGGINLVAEQLGSDPEAGKYIICAHYDDGPFYPNDIAPGADDNGSGVAAIIEAARILAHFTPRHSIIYVLWDMEEEGALGSNVYALDARTRNENIAGVLNIDMIGYDSNNDATINIHLLDTARSQKMADTIVYTNKIYDIGLNPVVSNPGITLSDHREFLAQGYSALLFCEDYDYDFHPYNHTSRDSSHYFNFPYFLKNVQLALGAFAQLADIDQSTGMSTDAGIGKPSDFELKQNFPNPFNPSTTIAFRIPSHNFVSLKIYDIMGRQIATLAAEELQAGQYSRNWNATGLASGMYYYRLQAGKFSKTNKLLLMR